MSCCNVKPFQPFIGSTEWAIGLLIFARLFSFCLAHESPRVAYEVSTCFLHILRRRNEPQSFIMNPRFIMCSIGRFQERLI
jgi:hypothetical protein